MHVQIGAFKVVSEAGIASGVRRIEAVVGPAAVEYLNQIDGVVRTLASQFKVKYEDIPGRVAGALPPSARIDILQVWQLMEECSRPELGALASLAIMLQHSVTA